jgi:hypothetical protein
MFFIKSRGVQLGFFKRIREKKMEVKAVRGFSLNWLD